MLVFRSGSVYILHIPQAFWCTETTFTTTKPHSSYVINVLNIYVFLERQRRHIQCDCSRPWDRKRGRPDPGQQLPNSWAPEWRALHFGPACAGSAGHHRRPSWPLTLLRWRWQPVPILVRFHSWKFSTLWFIVFVPVHTLTALKEKTLAYFIEPVWCSLSFHPWRPWGKPGS